MPPISPERFARLFRGLGPDDKAVFVAALWANRGWETTVDGTTVLATRADETVQVRVADPGRFGTPTLADIDVLVVARDRDAVRAAAADAGVRYLVAADIRELLLYGLERSTAAALFERTFGRPLETTGEPEPTLRERAQTVGTTLTKAVPGRTDSRYLLVLLLVGLLVGAAVAGPALTTQPEDTVAVAPVESVTPGDVGAVGAGTATPTPTGEASGDGEYPPGLGEHTLLDHVALADAHAAAVQGTSRTLQVTASGPPEAPLLNGREAWNATARIEHPREYLHETSAQFPGANGSTLTVNVYTDGETKYRQVRHGNETTYQRYATATTGDASGFADDVREYLVRYLAGDESSVECVATLTGGDCFAYRVVVTDPPAAVHAEATNYRAVAIVQEDGIVASLSVNYTLPVDGTRVLVTFQMAYSDIGNTTVSPPDWLETAKNETGG